MAPAVTAVDPLRVIEGGRLWLRGSDLPVPASHTVVCSVGGLPARVLFAAPTRMAIEVPSGLEGGSTEIKAPWLPGSTLFVEIGTAIATGVHQVDNPAIDADGCIYTTYSGSRGQESPVSIFRLRPPVFAREPYVSGIVNATSLAIGPDHQLYTSSRFNGSVYRIDEDGQSHRVASDLGLACGLAFAPDGTLLVGDRSGTIFHVSREGAKATLARLPGSVAAFHLAMGPDGWLYVSGPTMGTYDRVYRVSMTGQVETVDESFGRPQGLAFDADGVLHVVEALAGSSGVYQLRSTGKTLVIAGPRLVGVAFGAESTVVCANDTVYRFG